MGLNYFDVHSHLNLSPLFENRQEIIADMRGQGTGTITVGVDYDTSKKAVDMAHENSDILYATVGQHPTDSSVVPSDSEWAEFKKLAQDSSVVAIGECGIDYYRLKGSQDGKDIEIQRQKDLFIQHINLAKETGKPLMIHARPHVGSMDAYIDTIDILERENFIGHANFHFFVGDIEIAKRIIEHDWSVSFDGPITFTEEYNEVIKWLPLQNIMAETDAPFAAPMPHRGKTNSPLYVEFVYKKIAEIKGISLDEVRAELISNANRIFIKNKI